MLLFESPMSPHRAATVREPGDERTQTKSTFSDSTLDKIVELVREVDTGRPPEKIDEGCGESYLLRDRGGNELAVFKPQKDSKDDSPFKECAAYLLDGGFAGVPPTGLIALPWLDRNGKRTSKFGSIQAFQLEGLGADDFGPGVFSKDDIHKIGILDVRIMNCDRHSGNMLFCGRTKRLVPIDHGLSFPCALTELGSASFEWLLFPQAKQPFSKELLDYIEAIDIERDLEVMRALRLSEGSQLSLIMSTIMLKVGARSGKTLYDIGRMIQRQDDRSAPALIERLFRATISYMETKEYYSGEYLHHFANVFARLATFHMLVHNK